MRFSSMGRDNPKTVSWGMGVERSDLRISNPYTKSYTLRIDVFEGFQLPTNSEGLLHVQIGPYLFKTKKQPRLVMRKKNRKNLKNFDFSATKKDEIRSVKISWNEQYETSLI